MAPRKRGVYALVDDRMGFRFLRLARFDRNQMTEVHILAAADAIVPPYVRIRPAASTSATSSAGAFSASMESMP